MNGKCFLGFTEEKLEKFSDRFPIVTYGQKEKLLSIIASLNQEKLLTEEFSTPSGYILDDDSVSRSILIGISKILE